VNELQALGLERYVPAITVEIAGSPIAADLVVADLTIRSGRTRAEDGISPATATLELLTPAPAGGSISIGDLVVVGVDGRPRFTGRISEITSATSSSGGSLWTVVAAGGSARMGRILVDLPLAAASASGRAIALLEGAGYVADVRGGDGIGLAAYGEAGDAPVTLSSVLDAIAKDTGAVIADQPDGSILVQFLDSRLSDDRFTPDPAQTHVDVEWVQSDDLVNDCTVEYAGGAVQADNADSIARWDPHTLRLQTGLADAAGATTRATSIVARLGSPVWECGAVETWDPLVLEHEIGAVVTLAPLPASSPVGGSWSGVLEGWTDRYTPAADGTGELAASWQLAVSDLLHSSESVVWMDVDADLRWMDVDPACSWSEAVSNENLRPPAAAGVMG
jgi:hypothetical protein